MKILLSLCLAAVGVVGFTSVKADAAAPATPTVAVAAALPAVVHMNPTVVIETGHRRHYNRGRYYHRRHDYRRRYYYRHHRRYYY